MNIYSMKLIGGDIEIYRRLIFNITSSRGDDIDFLFNYIFKINIFSVLVMTKKIFLFSWDLILY